MLQVVQSQKTGKLSVEELPAPQLPSGCILVRNLASVISSGTERSSVETAEASLIKKARLRPDLMKQVMDSAKRDGLVATYKKVQTRLHNYKALGYSSAGIVVQSSVDAFKDGDRVACAGNAHHAELIVVPRNLAVKIPEGVSFEEAAFTAVGSIALQGVRQAEIQIAEVVAVIGLGLVGLITVQLLKANGCRVIGLDISADSFELAKKLGCDGCIVSNKSSVRRVERFTRGYGTDAVIIAAATKSNEPIELALQFARKKSRVVVVGAVGMDIPRSPFYEKELDLRISRSYGPGRYDPEYEQKGRDYPAAYVRWTENRNMEAVLELMAQKKLDVTSLITHKYPIQDALRAYKLLTGRSKERSLGILIEYPSDKGRESRDVRSIVLRAEPELRHDVARRTKAGAPYTDTVVGFIGAGNFAKSQLIPRLKQLGVRLRGVATSTPANAKSVAEKFGFEFCASGAEEIMNDGQINTVFIATRHDTHGQYLLEALRHGKRVFVEKPLAIDEQELIKIAKGYDTLAKEGKRPFVMVGYNRRFSLPMIAIKEFFGGRKEPLVLNYRVNADPIPETHWYRDVKQGGRIIGEVCHYVDAMLYLTHSAPNSAYAVGMGSPTDRSTSDNVSVTISFDDGSIGTISYVSSGSVRVEKEYLEVFGDGKSVLMEDFKNVLFFSDRRRQRKRFARDKGHQEELRVVLEGLRSNGPSPISFSSLLLTSLTTFKAVESLRERQSKRIPHLSVSGDLSKTT
jgi:predicted dehydrogenase/threonine dehydrogenase-like Zn-dependent dehydrogenase